MTTIEIIMFVVGIIAFFICFYIFIRYFKNAKKHEEYEQRKCTSCRWYGDITCECPYKTCHYEKYEEEQKWHNLLN